MTTTHLQATLDIVENLMEEYTQNDRLFMENLNALYLFFNTMVMRSI